MVLPFALQSQESKAAQFHFPLQLWVCFENLCECTVVAVYSLSLLILLLGLGCIGRGGFVPKVGLLKVLMIEEPLSASPKQSCSEIH